jgi:chromosome partitioning protein
VSAIEPARTQARKLPGLQTLTLSFYRARVAEVISFVNAKGGVGKSTLAVHLAVWLADCGHRVALLDADDQLTAAKWLSRIACHSVTLKTLDSVEEASRADELHSATAELVSSHDFVVIDTKGSAVLSTSAAVVKSDFVFVPLQASASDIWPIEKVLSVVRLSKEARADKPVAKFILNFTDDRDILAKDIGQLAKRYGMEVARTNLKRLNAYRDAAGTRTVATRLSDRRSMAAARRLRELFEELIGECLTRPTQRAGNE